MKNPVHPGQIVQHDCLEPLGLSLTAGAKVLGVSRHVLSKMFNGESGIAAEMAESKIKVRRQHVRGESASDTLGPKLNVVQ